MEHTGGNGSAIRRSRVGQRLSRFCFTVNNWTETEWKFITDFPCRWLVVGREVGEEGTRHLQGACVIGKQMSFSSLKTTPGFERAHIEVMRGTPEDSLRYCSKEDTDFFVKGEMPLPGKRNDLHNIVERIHNGDSLQTLAKDTEGAVAIVKFHKGLRALSDMLRPHRTEPPKVWWLHGKTGTGKTRGAVEFAEQHGWDYWISNGSLQWFDGYHGQRVAIVDDLRTRDATFNFTLRLFDRYRLDVPIKGGWTRWDPEFIIITCPYDPARLWSLRCDEDKQQLVRRCTYIWDMEDGSIPFGTWLNGGRDGNEVLVDTISYESDDSSIGDYFPPAEPDSGALQKLDQIFTDALKEQEKRSVRKELTCLETINPDDFDPPAQCGKCSSIGNCCKHDGLCNYIDCISCPFQD